MPFKTASNWLFNDIWCCLVFVFFIEKLWSQKGTPTCSDNNLRWQSTRTIWHASFSCSIRFEFAVLPYYRRPFTDYNYKIKVLFKNGCVMMYVNRFSRRAYQWHMRRRTCFSMILHCYTWQWTIGRYQRMRKQIHQ